MSWYPYMESFFESQIALKLLEFCFGLEKLSLRKNNLTLEMINSICYQNDNSLKVLDLSFCTFSDNQKESGRKLELIVKNCVELKELNLSACFDFSHDSLEFLASNITPEVNILPSCLIHYETVQGLIFNFVIHFFDFIKNQ